MVQNLKFWEDNRNGDLSYAKRFTRLYNNFYYKHKIISEISLLS